MGQGPSPPQRSNFYTVVCGGTWLNRKDWDDAKAEHRTDTRVATQLQDQAFTRQVLNTQAQQTQRQQSLQAFINRLPLPQPVRQLANQVVNLLAQGLQRLQQSLARQTERLQQTLKQLRNPLQLAQQALRNGAVARVLGFFMGNTREARSSTKASENEQQQRDDFDGLTATQELFSTDKVGETGETLLGGGGGKR